MVLMIDLRNGDVEAGLDTVQEAVNDLSLILERKTIRAVQRGFQQGQKRCQDNDAATSCS